MVVQVNLALPEKGGCGDFWSFGLGCLQSSASSVILEAR